MNFIMTLTSCDGWLAIQRPLVFNGKSKSGALLYYHPQLIIIFSDFMSLGFCGQSRVPWRVTRSCNIASHGEEEESCDTQNV